MLFIFITFFSFSFYFGKDLSIKFPFAKLFNIISPKLPKDNNINMVNEGMSMLDLPDLALECILEKLEPDGLCRIACVSTYFRDLCLSDHLWEGHLKKRWGTVFGPSAYNKWKLHISSMKESNDFLSSHKGRGFFYKLWHVMLVRLNGFIRYDNGKKMKISSQPSIDSVVSCYRALETGKFWFPAQVFNRENGHVGFMLSCYDADLSYDSRSDTFQARYPPHARRPPAIETGVSWDRIRASPVDTSPQDLHISDCLNNLRPKDHIEIQWRRNKQFPYGWWYGVVAHLEACDGNYSHCHCHQSDTVVLEFNQYSPASRWRRTTINRRDHREEGNEADGFYGGIRKLNRKDEVSTWQQFWPAEILE